MAWLTRCFELTLLLPYRRKRRKVEYGDMSAQTGDRRIWADDV
jgi:hypothetical protein